METFLNTLFFFCSDNILMSEEKQRILLLERVNTHNVSITLNSIAQETTIFFVCLYLINLIYVSDFTHEGRRKQTPQSKTGQLIIITVGYVTSAPLGGSSMKE